MCLVIDALVEAEFVELNGLFSGLIIDRRRARASLFNDRYGVERVYVHETEHGTYFASEAKALLTLPGVTAAIDPAALQTYLALGYVAAPQSMFRGIRKLAPATVLLRPV